MTMPTIAGFTLRQRRLLELNSLIASRPDVVRGLLDRFGPGELPKVPVAFLAEAAGWTPEDARIRMKLAFSFDVEAELERCAKAGVSIFFHGEPGYPEMLQSTEDAPLALYVKGSLSPEASPLAFVGSRTPTAYGRRMAARLVADAAAAGYCIVSGLARGIDTEAHEAALRCEGPTWAVLGSGLGRVYPAENSALAERILKAGGALVSEFPMQAAPLSHHFPRRNRIISALSWATVVIEGRMKSGSLITAKYALKQSREVLALPGPADSPLSEAPHYLIANGARLALRLADIVAVLPAGARRPEPRLIMRKDDSDMAGTPGLSLEEQKILESLGSDSLTVEELSRSTGLDFVGLTTIIFGLEIKNLLTPLPGQRYAKKGNES